MTMNESDHYPYSFVSEDLKMTGKALKLIRQFHNVKQYQLAAELKISKSYLSEIESETKEVTLDLLEKYSTYFKIPMSSLMLFSENLDSISLSGRFRTSFASKIKQILEWVVAKDDHLGADKT